MKKLLLIFIFLPTLLMAQRDWANLEIEVTEEAPGIHRLFLGGSVSVTAFSGDEGLLVIDAAWEQSTDRLMEELSKISSAPVTYLVNTHLHGDHTGGNPIVGKDAEIIAHPSVRDYLSTEQKSGETVIPPMPEHAWPTRLVEDKLEIEFNGQKIVIQHIGGGHTKGDLIVYFPESKVLVVGDLLFAGFFPFVDTSNGGNPHKYLENVMKLMNDFPGVEKVIGGHGPVFTMRQMKDWHYQLSLTMEKVQSAKAQGLTVDQIKEQKLLADWDQMGSFFITADRWIDTVYPFL
jgi:glyoxylase-like metal-dependent hydrolase (beta-lactamase superfamily II)